MGIQTVAQRDKLKARHEPYFHKLETGRFLGFYKTRTAETWLVRTYDPVERKQVKHALGDFGNLPANERFTAAVRAARDWLKHLDAGGSTDVVTVAQACERYAEHLSRDPSGKKGKVKAQAMAKEARRRFIQYVNSDPIASVPLPKLRKHHVADWRTRLAETPATFRRSGERGVGRGKGRGKVTRPRSPITLDRDIAPVRAALRLAMEDGLVTSDQAWLKVLKGNGRRERRNLYLDRKERRALIDAIPGDALRDFVSALALLPLRPGAMAALTVTDFNASKGTLRIRDDKAGEGRSILLPETTASVFAKAARGKTPAAPLFARPDGARWRADEWVKAIKVAVRSAKLPPETVAYTLRHSTITDLVTDGLDLFTVASIAGTSVPMIEKHYGHLRQKLAADALAKLAL